MISGERLPLCRMRASDRTNVVWRESNFVRRNASGRSRGPRTTISTAPRSRSFFGSEYTVQSGSDRVGMRLQGEAIRHAKGFNIASDATAPGSIQVPGNGQPIVLMADRQTIGGYPKIATVISADLPELGRLSIGSKIVFESVTLEAAQSLRRSMSSYLDDLPDRIVPIGRTGADVAPLLFSHNLISGVVDAVWIMRPILMGNADPISQIGQEAGSSIEGKPPAAPPPAAIRAKPADNVPLGIVYMIAATVLFAGTAALAKLMLRFIRW